MSIKIGITPFKDVKNSREFLSLSYQNINSVRLAGCIPIIIPLIKDEKEVENYLDIVDGILFTGGSDISPSYYDEEPISGINALSPDRDICEHILFKKAVKRKMPIFGICRGCQFINVSMGGSLYQDIYKQKKNVNGHNPNDIKRDELYHSVKIIKDSILFSIFEKEDIYVNSFHHQAIKQLGDGLRISALSSDGIIEAIESNDGLIMGVQWHPEDLTAKYEEFIKLYKYFAKKCEDNKINNHK